MMFKEILKVSKPFINRASTQSGGGIFKAKRFLGGGIGCKDKNFKIGFLNNGNSSIGSTV